MNRTVEMIKIFLHDMPSTVKAALTATVFVWAFYGYKEIEPIINPVVINFDITSIEDTPEGTRIAGTLDKRRDCKFEAVLAYSAGALVDVVFTDVVHNVGVSRVTGRQAWGWWIIVPSVPELTLYSRHSCDTGKVLTKLYDGVL